MSEDIPAPLSISRFRGCLLGLAAGDALGTTVEFSPPGSFSPLTDMVGGGKFHLAAGQWTDDTSMALCLAESLVEKMGFDPVDQLERYVRWYRTAYLSSTGHFFDIGGTTAQALRRFERTRDPYPGLSDFYNSGNGSLMRLAPVPMFYARQVKLCLEKCADSSRTTHASPLAVDACRYFGALITLALNGRSKEEILEVPQEWIGLEPDVMNVFSSLQPMVLEVANGSFKEKHPPEIQGTGFVVDSMEAALWAFYHGESFEEGALLAANLGDDADTTAAIYGQLAGAYYGEAGIPARWLEKLAMREFIMGLAERIYKLSL